MSALVFSLNTAAPWMYVSIDVLCRASDAFEFCESLFSIDLALSQIIRLLFLQKYET